MKLSIDFLFRSFRVKSVRCQNFFSCDAAKIVWLPLVFEFYRTRYNSSLMHDAGNLSSLLVPVYRYQINKFWQLLSSIQHATMSGYRMYLPGRSYGRTYRYKLLVHCASLPTRTQRRAATSNDSGWCWTKQIDTEVRILWTTATTRTSCIYCDSSCRDNQRTKWDADAAVRRKEGTKRCCCYNKNRNSNSKNFCQWDSMEKGENKTQTSTTTKGLITTSKWSSR